MLSHTTAQPDTQNRILEWPDGTRYEGEVLNGQMHGEGTIYWPDGTRFEGSFTNNMRDGEGRLIFPDGAEFTGVFEDNQLIAEEIAVEIEEAEPPPPARLPEPEAVPAEQVAQEAQQEAPVDSMPEIEIEAEAEEREGMVGEMDRPMAEADEVADMAEEAIEESVNETIPESFPEPGQPIAEQRFEYDQQVDLEQNLPENAEEMPETAEAELPEIPAPEPATQIEPEPAPAAAETLPEQPALAGPATGSPEEEIEVRPSPAIASNGGERESPEMESQEETVNYTDELENEIVAVVDAWARAWSAQNPALYLSFYADDFAVPDGLSRAAWENQRRNRLNAPEFIQVDVGYAQFELLDNNTIEVSLRQGYSSDTYSDFTNKLLRLRREDGLWKIVGEETI